jgi:dTDP-4-dehydrorhamnose reductase
MILQSNFELSATSVRVKPLKTMNIRLKAIRPVYSVMDKARLNTFQIPYWRDSLAECIRQFNGEKMEIVNSM